VADETAGDVSVELLDAVTDTDPVWSRVRSRIEDSLPDLPAGATRPAFEELEVRAYALIVGVTWDRDGPPDHRLLRRLAVDLQDVLQNLPGTDAVDRFADPGEEIEVEIDPAMASSIGMTPGEVATRLASFDVKESAGQVRRKEMQLLLEVGNQLDLVSQIGQTPIRDQESSFVRLNDVATVRVGVPDPPGRAALLDGKEAVVLGAMVRPSYRIDRWTRQAEVALADFSASLPAGVVLDSVLRQSDYVDERLGSLIKNLLVGAAAVSIVIFLLMGWRSALLVTLTLPLASLMVLFCLRLFGIPIHQMSITGLIISLGLLIDNAIVIVDEVRGQLKRGKSRGAAMAGAVSHLAVPLLGSTLTTALAFAPIALMPGPAGEFVGAIAFSVIFAIFSSLFLALTVIPSLASRFLPMVDDGKPTGSSKGGLAWVRDWVRRGIHLPRMTRTYERSIRILIRRPLLGIGVSVMAPVVGFLVFPTLREQFFPASGRNQFHVTVEGPATSSLAQTRRTAEKVDQLLRQADVARVDWFFGESAPQFYYNVIANRRGTRNFAQALVTTKTQGDPLNLIRRLQSQLDREVTSSRVLVRQLEQGPPFEAPVEIRLFGPELQTLRNLGDEVRELLSSIPEVTYCRADMNEVLPQLSIDVDGESARMADLSPSNIAGQLMSSLEGRVGGSVLQDNEELPIVVRVKDIDRGSLDRITSMEIVSGPFNDGQGIRQSVRRVPLSAVADVKLNAESAAIPRLNRQRMNEVSAYIEAGVLPSEVQKRIEALIESRGPLLPDGYRLEYGGEASKRDDAVGNLFSTVGVLAVLMMATLVLSFGSFRMAGIISVVAAMAVGLGLGSLAMGGYPFGFMSIIGTMGLIGVAINDSIVVLAAIRSNPNAAAGDLDAMVSEVLLSSRHVIATTLTTMAGFAPLILDGGLFWPPMAVCIAGGVAGATLLALVLVPACYRLLMCPDKTRRVATV
ncbi:MAG: efflux RND transporter permease subunit, partial [Planctomycetota bacterium]